MPFSGALFGIIKTMRIFCANSFTNEDFTTVSNRMRLVVDTLNKSGHEAYCPVFDPHKIALQEKNETKKIFEYSFKNIAERDALVAIISSKNKSEGMLMEIGAALSKNKPVYVFVHKSLKSVPSHLPKLATKTFSWDSLQDLEQALTKI